MEQHPSQQQQPANEAEADNQTRDFMRSLSRERLLQSWLCLGSRLPKSSIGAMGVYKGASIPLANIVPARYRSMEKIVADPANVGKSKTSKKARKAMKELTKDLDPRELVYGDSDSFITTNLELANKPKNSGGSNLGKVSEETVEMPPMTRKQYGKIPDPVECSNAEDVETAKKFIELIRVVTAKLKGDPDDDAA